VWAGATLLLLCVASEVSAESELKTKFKQVAQKYGEWGQGHQHEKRGQM